MKKKKKNREEMEGKNDHEEKMHGHENMNASLSSTLANR